MPTIPEPPDYGNIPPWGDEDIDHAAQGREPREAATGERNAPSKVEPDWQRPVIVRTSEVHLDADKAMRALMQCPDVEIFSYGQALVEVVRIPGKQPGLSALKRPRLQELLSRASQWMSGDGENQRQIRAPRDIAEVILSRPDCGAPVLDGIVVTPTMRPDGSILDTPGYDRATRRVFEPSAEFPPIPTRPSHKHAKAALQVLQAAFVDFPWLDTCDKSAAISAMLSLIARPAICGPIPLFAIRASTPGTGKTLLADVLAIIATGQPARRTVPTSHDEEMRKRIFALALEGAPIVLLDNVEGDLGSASLAAALTGTTYQDRVLGASVTRSIPLHTVWLATGNGLAFRGDLGRRVVPIDLDARVEHPEDRTGFQYPDLRAYVCAERPRLVAAGLTVVRAYYLAGRPRHGSSPMGSFESWDELIRGACIWLGLPDPAYGRQRIREQGDSEIEALRALMAAWDGRLGSAPVTSADVVKATKHDDELHAALEALVHPKPLTARALGAALKRYQRRPVGGRSIRAAGVSGGATRWCLVPARSAAHDRGMEAT